MLLAFDLDGTVVTHQNEIPSRILKAVAKAKDAGHIITVLTGRPKASALEAVHKLGAEHLYAVNHGAVVIGENDTVLSRSLINEEDVRTIIGRYGLNEGLEYAFMIDDDIFVNRPEDPRWSWAHTLNRNVLPFSEDAVQDADKIILSADEEGPRVYSELRRAHPEMMNYLWPDGFLEITGVGADKGTALAFICRELGVAQKDTIAFGDGVNDVTMMQWAGRAVAVGTAHPDVLTESDEHIAEPEQNGVADWLAENLLAARVWEAKV